METTTNRNCSRVWLSDSHEPKATNDNNLLSLSCTIICLILLGVYYSKPKIIRKFNTKHVKSSQTFLGFSDLPAVKARIPLKLIGNIPDIFPLRQAMDTTLGWSRTYGDVFTCIGLGQKFVILNSGPTIEALMKSGDFGHVTKAPVLYDPMKPFVTNGVLVSKGAFWQQQRRLIMKTQTSLSIKSYIPMIERYSKRLVGEMDKLLQHGGSHQINSLINITFIGIISEIITGKQMNDLSELKEYHHNFTIWKECIFMRLINPLLQLQLIWMFHSLKKPYESALKGLTDYARRRLDEHKMEKRSLNCLSSEIPSRRCILDEFVNAGVTEKQIIDEINTVMFGGHETGASTMHFLCFCFALNPQIQEVARMEIDKLFENNEYEEDGWMTYDFIRTRLNYLELCILETLRLFPPVFAMARKLESPLEFEYEGKPVLIPAGVNAIVFPLALQRREELYPDPERFDPDRFTSEECSKRHAYSYIPFSGGPRNCLGQRLAMIEMKIIAAYVLRNFELSTTDSLKDVKLLPHTTLTPEKDFTFVLKRRSV